MFAPGRGILSPNVIFSVSRILAPHRTARRGMAWSITEWTRKKLQPKFRQAESLDIIEAAKQRQAERGESNLFDTVGKEFEEDTSPLERAKRKRVHTSHKYSTGVFKISPRKLNMLGRQISGKPIDQAILQMVFSEKRASTRIKSVLCTARDHAQDKGLDRSKLVVAEAWVAKGKVLKALDIKGRGRHGVKKHRYARLNVLLKEGKTREEIMAATRAQRLKRIVSPGLVREDRPIRNPSPMWAW